MAEKKPARSYKLPPEFKDEGEFLEHIRVLFQHDYDADRENIDAALDDLEFMSGNQWDPEAKRIREGKGRPCLVINGLPQFVGQVIGDMRINRPSIKFRPAEDADKDLADVRAGLVRGIEHSSDALGVYAQAGEDQVICGIGNFRVNLEYVDDDVFDQDIRIRGVPNPLGVIWDAMSVERTGADATHCWVIDEVPRKAFEKRYEGIHADGFADVLTSTSWATRDVVRVVEYWRIKETERTVALLADGTIKDITDDPEAYADQIAMTEDGKPRQRKVMRKSACMWIVTGSAIIEGPYELPINRVPVFRVMGREVRVGTKRIRFGLVRFAKDAQRLKNYWRSVGAELLALSPRQVWLARRTERNAEALDDLRTAHLSGDPVLEWEGNSEFDKPERMLPPPFPDAVLREAQLNAQDMKDVTGLHDASLGIQSNETSGKAILARQREGDVATFMYHDNLNAAIREAGNVVNQLIPVVYDTARTIRVIGEDEGSKLQRINDPNDPESIDLGKGKYDVVVETGPSYSTKRVESAESMMAFVQAVPQAAAAAGDIIARSQDWPLADELAERLKKMLPPGIADQEDEDKSPEQQQAEQQAKQMQQAQMQMQMEAAQADTDLKKAQARKAMAEAVKAEAEAEAAMRGPPPEAPEVPEDPRKVEAEIRLTAAKAEREIVALASDKIDLEAKPANVALDLKLKAEPPEPKAPAKAKA